MENETVTVVTTETVRPDAASSQTPTLDAPANGAQANPPAPGDEPRTFAAVDEIQREVGEDGIVVNRRSVASAFQGTAEGITGAPDGIGGEHEGGQGQTPPADLTEEAEEKDDGDDDGDKGGGEPAERKPARKSRS